MKKLLTITIILLTCLTINAQDFIGNYPNYERYCQHKIHSTFILTVKEVKNSELICYSKSPDKVKEIVVKFTKRIPDSYKYYKNGHKVKISSTTWVGKGILEVCQK
jgi:hypothetical protein